MDQRKKDILAYLKKNESVKISALAEMCNVSQVTIRKDITQLEEQWLIVRYHGRISIVNAETTPYFIREDANCAQKRLVAREALKLIRPSDTIILDAGTTTMAIAEEMIHLPPRNIVTNSIPIATQLRNTNHTITMSGGVLLNRSMCTVGPDAEAFFNKIEADKVFLGCYGLRENQGLTTNIILEASVKRAMLHAAKEVIAVFDGSKFSQTALEMFAGFEEIDKVITTHPLEETPVLKELEQRGIQVIFADD